MNAATRRKTDSTMLGRKNRIRRNTYKSRPKNGRKALLSRLGRGLRLMVAAGTFVLFNLLLILGYDWMTQTERLAIRSISVSGCHRLTAGAVKSQAGLTSARNILAVNLTATRKRLLAHPWIAEAQVRRDIPDRLEIHIREHGGLAVLNLGRRFLLSDKGQVFTEVKPGEFPDLPVVSGLTYNDLGVSATAPAPVLRAVMTLLQPRPREARQAMVQRIREIHADAALGLTVFLDDGRLPSGYRTVMLGFGDFEAKYATLQKIDAYVAQNPQFTGIQSIDVKNLNRIIVQPMATGAADSDRKEV
jgi:cell division protein FtsQ